MSGIFGHRGLRLDLGLELPRSEQWSIRHCVARRFIRVQMLLYVWPLAAKPAASTASCCIEIDGESEHDMPRIGLSM